MSKLAKKMIGEEFSLNPSYATDVGNPPGDSKIVAANPYQEVDTEKDEEKQELKIAKKILKAAAQLPKSPPQQDIIRQAEELKRIHDVA